MKKTLNITESDIINIAKQVISEQFDDKKKTKKVTKKRIRKQEEERQTASVLKYVKKLAEFDMNLNDAYKLHSRGGEENDVHAMLLLIEGIIKAETLAVAGAVIQQKGHFDKGAFNNLMSERTFGGRVQKLMAALKYLQKQRQKLFGNDIKEYTKPIKKKIDEVERLISAITKTGDLPQGSRTADEFMYHIEQLKNFTSTVYGYLDN
jgi:thymidylate synthase